MTHPLDWRPISELPDEWPEGPIGIACHTPEPKDEVLIGYAGDFYRLHELREDYNCFADDTTKFAFIYPPQTEEQP